MKVAVINFSGNIGKTTVARDLLAPRIPGAEVVAVESLNADDSEAQALRGRQFGELQEYMHTVDSAVVDIGASNVEDLLGLMQRYQGSHEDFDCFIVPTVGPVKQQHDTVTTLVELSRLGVRPERIRLLFNMVDDARTLHLTFTPLLGFLAEQPIAGADPRCYVRTNEIYQRLRGSGADLVALAHDAADYKAEIARATSTEDKLTLAQKLATQRLARGVVPELDACFAALGLAKLTHAELPAA